MTFDYTIVFWCWFLFLIIIFYIDKRNLKKYLEYKYSKANVKENKRKVSTKSKQNIKNKWLIDKADS